MGDIAQQPGLGQQLCSDLILSGDIVFTGAGLFLIKIHTNKCIVSMADSSANECQSQGDEHREHLGSKDMQTRECHAERDQAAGADACNVDDDFLDAIFMAEEGFEDHGFKEGYSRGERSGFDEGRQTGHMKGQEVGAEIGFYHGFAAMWKALLDKEQNTSKKRAKKVLETLLTMLQDFPMAKPTHESFWEDLNKIRAKFKQASSLVNVTIDASGGEPSTRPTMSF